MADDFFNITIKIAERKFSLKIRREEEELYRQAALRVNAKYAGFLKHRNLDLVDLLALTSLNLAVENVSADKSLDVLENLDSELDAILSMDHHTTPANEE